jgi:hypothetical protein
MKKTRAAELRSWVECWVSRASYVLQVWVVDLLDAPRRESHHG